jgi:hypothetical protein
MSRLTRRKAHAASLASDKPKHVIRIDDTGYFGSKPWTAVPKEEATQYIMKDARRVLNRLRDRLGYPKAEIEDAPVKTLA